MTILFFGCGDERTSVTVLIPLFLFSSFDPPKHNAKWQANNSSIVLCSAVAASAESFDNCQSSSTLSGPGANSLRCPPLGRGYFSCDTWLRKTYIKQVITNVVLLRKSRFFYNYLSIKHKNSITSYGKSQVIVMFPQNYHVKKRKPRRNAQKQAFLRGFFYFFWQG